jgi:eukaryotic-like serine/threonine-protein kinase
MKILQILLLILLALPFLAAQKNNKIKWIKMNDSNYSIQYPNHWELKKEEANNIKFIVLSPQSSESDEFRENVNLNEQNIKGMGIDLDVYVSVSIDQIGSMIKNSEFIANERKKTKKSEYHKFIYSGEMGNFRLTFIQYCWVKPEKAYVLTFTTEQSEFKSHIDYAEKIMNSFKFK